jgi:hypothetical protein
MNKQKLKKQPEVPDYPRHDINKERPRTRDAANLIANALTRFQPRRP